MSHTIQRNLVNIEVVYFSLKFEIDQEESNLRTVLNKKLIAALLITAQQFYCNGSSRVDNDFSVLNFIRNTRPPYYDAISFILVTTLTFI